MVQRQEHAAQKSPYRLEFCRCDFHSGEPRPSAAACVVVKAVRILGSKTCLPSPSPEERSQCLPIGACGPHPHV